MGITHADIMKAHDAIVNAPRPTAQWRQLFEEQRAAADKQLSSEIDTAEKCNRLVYARSALPRYTGVAKRTG